MMKLQQSFNISFARRPSKVKVNQALPNNYIIMTVIGPNGGILQQTIPIICIHLFT